MERKRISLVGGVMGALAISAAILGPETLDRILPEPKPRKQRTPEDEARIHAAAERRAKRNAKWAKQGNSDE